MVRCHLGFNAHLFTCDNKSFFDAFYTTMVCSFFNHMLFQNNISYFSTEQNWFQLLLA